MVFVSICINFTTASEQAFRPAFREVQVVFRNSLKYYFTEMKKLLFLALAISFTSLMLSAQTATPAPKDSIIFDQLTHDYGTIKVNSDGNCIFTFTNKGTEPLVLSNVQASCGCTVPDWTREPVAPGQTGTVKVTYNTAIIGAFHKSITVNSNAVNNTVVLVIQGVISSD
jgi:hypothetical protein